MKVHPTTRLSTRILRLLDEKGPLTVVEIVSALSEPGADLDREHVATILRNFRHRGRVVSGDKAVGVQGNPARWSITPAASASLAAVRTRKPRAYRPPRAWELRRPKPRDLSPEVSRFCRWFLAAGWGERETARLFGLKPRDLEPLRSAKCD